MVAESGIANSGGFTRSGRAVRFGRQPMLETARGRHRHPGGGGERLSEKLIRSGRWKLQAQARAPAMRWRDLAAGTAVDCVGFSVPPASVCGQLREGRTIDEKGACGL